MQGSSGAGWARALSVAVSTRRAARHERRAARLACMHAAVTRMGSRTSAMEWYRMKPRGRMYMLTRMRRSALSLVMPGASAVSSGRCSLRV
jgi:hypothetical protein